MVVARQRRIDYLDEVMLTSSVQHFAQSLQQ
jgi:hypothetical protein